jgi:acyl-CoA dehydrogenase
MENEMLDVLAVIAVLSAVGVLMTKQASIVVWTISIAILVALVLSLGNPGIFAQISLWIILGIFVLAAIKPLRRQLISRHLLAIIRRAMPVMSSTEREALDAGTVSWEGDLMSGSPDFSVLHNMHAIALTPEEQAFLDGPVNHLCRMLDDWDITHNRTDLPPEVWTYIKEQGFLGMIIPKRYGGLEFSATAQMSVLVKLYSRSVSVATTVGVPNSLGPGELLLKYGTEEQKNYYLPRLAKGVDIPCFALTSPNAGSDAASIPDQGIVCRQVVNGEEVLGMRLIWDKRYITLCPIATIIGLAFRLFDPDNLLGKGADIGICCALIPAHTPGVIKGRRHFPLNTAFLNGPTQGNDVFVPIDCLIGGVEMAGKGWRMLMECLSAGRAISLPSSASGGVQAVALATGAYARVRKQFNQPIAKFEGIEEPLARIAANAYIIDAALTMTAGAIDRGAKPSVAGAILKYHTTERSRQVAVDAMDIHGGKGICLGPNNYLGRGYQSAPISITVEGANILSRSLIIFGQGAIRCHPYVYREMESAQKHDLKGFDEALWAHAGFILANVSQSFIFALTDARWTKAPDTIARRYYQLIHRYSSHLAVLTDFSMISLGGELKRREKISARLGDVLSYLYLASAVLHRFQLDGELATDLPLVEWSCQHLLHECEATIQAILANFPIRWAKIPLKLLLQPLGHQRHKPSDHLGKTLARILTEPNETRRRLTRLAFHEALPNCPLGQVEEAFHKLCEVEASEKKVIRAAKDGLIQSLSFMQQIDEATAQGLLTSIEAARLKDAELARQKVIAVDDFHDNELRRSTEVVDLHHRASKVEVV